MGNLASSRANFLHEVKKDFSNNQHKQLARLSGELGEEAAISLVGMTGRTSRSEIDVIAEIIKPFKPLSIYSYQLQPRKIVLEGSGPEGHIIRIHPQYAVAQPDMLASSGAPQHWFVDVAIELHRRFENDAIRIAIVGFEYDGHDAHYLESRIKKSHLRDVGIMHQEYFIPMHIAPEYWKKHPKLYIETMMKFFLRRIEEVQAMEYRALNKMYLEQVDVPEFVLVGSGRKKKAIPLIRHCE